VTPSDFAGKLRNLVSLHMTGEMRGPERGAEMIEALAASLGAVIAVAGQGDRDLIETLLTGCEGYIQDSAAQNAPLGKMLAGAR
jgi:hypothetical protein